MWKNPNILQAFHSYLGAKNGRKKSESIDSSPRARHCIVQVLQEIGQLNFVEEEFTRTPEKEFRFDKWYTAFSKNIIVSGDVFVENV